MRFTELVLMLQCPNNQSARVQIRTIQFWRIFFFLFKFCLRFVEIGSNRNDQLVCLAHSLCIMSILGDFKYTFDFAVVYWELSIVYTLVCKLLSFRCNKTDRQTEREQSVTFICFCRQIRCYHISIDKTVKKAISITTNKLD